MYDSELIRQLPGGLRALHGLSDLSAGIESENALWLSMARSRLSSIGLLIAPVVDDPEIKLYQLLQNQYGDGAHAKFNALRRLLVSFQRALQCARS